MEVMICLYKEIEKHACNRDLCPARNRSQYMAIAVITVSGKIHTLVLWNDLPLSDREETGKVYMNA